MGHAEPCGQLSQPSVQSPQRGTRGHEGRRQEMDVDKAAAKTIELSVFNERQDFGLGRQSGRAQQSDVVQGPAPWRRWRATSQLTNHHRMGQRQIQHHQLDQCVAAVPEVGHPYRGVYQHIHGAGSASRRRGTSCIPCAWPPSAARRLAACTRI